MGIQVVPILNTNVDRDKNVESVTKVDVNVECLVSSEQCEIPSIAGEWTLNCCATETVREPVEPIVTAVFIGGHKTKT